MTLTQNQIHEILSIIEKQTAFYIGSTLGEDYLTREQKSILEKSGVSPKSLYKTTNDTVLMNYHLGMLSEILGNKAVKSMTYDQLKQYVNSGQHIPLNQEEKAQIESIKRQSLADITSRKGKVFQDINQVLSNESSSVRAQHEFIRQTVIEGLKRRESVKKISMDLAKLTGDWTRDFEKSVNYISHTAMNEGRLAMIQKRYENRGEAKVYFIVQDTACEHCVKAYLTAGKGSEPREFTIRELLQNGNNIGRKAHEYLPTISPLHPHSLTQGKTKVLTDNGWKQIRHIEVGDYVLTHKGRFRRVNSVLKDWRVDRESYKDRKRVQIYFKTNKRHSGEKVIRQLSLTDEHLVLTQLGWITAGELNKDIHKLKLLMAPCSCGCGEYVEFTPGYGPKFFDKEKCKSRKGRQLAESNLNEETRQRSGETIKRKVESGELKYIGEQFKTEEHREAARQRMLNGGALKAARAASNVRVSKSQLGLYQRVKKYYPEAKLEYRIFNRSLDIAIPSLKIDIEFDGSYWHERKREDDKKRDELLKSNGWHVLRYVDKVPSKEKLLEDIQLVGNNSSGEYQFKEIEIEKIRHSKLITYTDEYRDKNTKLYDISVEEDESFIARGVVIHNCRCLLHEIHPNTEWNDERRQFVGVAPEKYKPTIKRSKVKIQFNGKEYMV